MALVGCTVLSVDEDKAIRGRRSGDLDPTAYVGRLWAKQAVPALDAAAVPLPVLMSAMSRDLDAAGRSYGRRAGEDSAWTFVVKGSGRISSVDTTSPHGHIMVALGSDQGGREVQIQLGPVVEGSAVRDALPFVSFDDFADQLSFADVGRALTSRALAGVRPIAAQLQAGQVVSFTGVVNVRDARDPLIVTPTALVVAHVR
ncbi:MAG: DUF2291 domain-containing protein [Rhizorhabdus sp.]